MILGATSIVLNNNKNKLPCYKGCVVNNLPPLYYRCRNCDTQLNTNTPSNKYQIQKRIQKTVRVASSLYTMNLASLSSFDETATTPTKTCWNQMSDRSVPHTQPSLVASGSQYSGNSTKRSITRLRPGALVPGGTGVDIKHNSYARHLNRLKGQSILKRGPIPANYGVKVPFNLAYPVYGNKTVKTNIVSGCNCPSPGEIEPSVFPNNIYSNEHAYSYSVGQKVYIITQTPFVSGTIETKISENVFNIVLDELVDVSNVYKTTKEVTSDEIIPYDYCDCNIGTELNPLFEADKLCRVYNKLLNTANVIAYLKSVGALPEYYVF
jgi:hypothetical protein